MGKNPNDYINYECVRSSWREGLLILMYHAIETPPLRHNWRALYVEPSKLRSQLKELQANGVKFVSLSDWNRNRTNERQVAVTFDDGFQNVLLQGLPVLQELKIPAINYIVTNLIGKTNLWDKDIGAQSRPLMSRSEIDAWLQAGHEIGSHTLTHPKLPNLPIQEARREIFESKKILEDLFSRPIRHFCYPYGWWNPALRDLVIEAGYETACSSWGITNLHDADPFTFHRLFARHRRPYVTALGRILQNFLMPNKHS